MYVIYSVCLLILFELMLEIAYKRTSHYKNKVKNIAKFKRVPYDLDIVNIGSGPSVYGISYDEYQGKGYNLGTAPQSFMYGLRLLQRYSEHIKEGAIIIIIIMCPLSFANNKDYLRPGYSDQFYGILPPEHIINYSYKRAFMLKFPLLLGVLRKIKSKFIRKQSLEITDDNDCSAVIKCWKQEFNLNDLKNDGSAKKHEEAFEKKISTVNDIIDFCHEKKWRPVLVIPPIPESTRKHISSEFIKAFVYDNISKIQKRNKGIKLLDYFSDTRIDKNMYLNDIFMNQTGRKIFSKILFNDVKQEL